MIDLRCWQPRVHDGHDWPHTLPTYHCDGRPFTRRAVSPDAPLRPETLRTSVPDQQDGAGACTYCGASVDVWPRRDCEEPQQHTTAVYECDCGEAVTITEAIEQPTRHRRCNLIDTGRIEMGALVATFLVCVIGISLFALAVLGARTGLCKVDDTHSYCHTAQR